MKITKSKAIEILSGFLDNISEVAKLNNAEDPNFTKWRRDLNVALENIFEKILSKFLNFENFLFAQL
jgi:hypothetical protein